MMGKICTVRSRLGMMKSLSRTENAGVAPRDERTQKLFGDHPGIEAVLGQEIHA